MIGLVAVVSQEKKVLNLSTERLLSALVLNVWSRLLEAWLALTVG